MNRKERRKLARTDPTGWTPWEQGQFNPLKDEQVAEIARRTGRPVEDVQHAMSVGAVADVFWLNNVYQVAIRPVTNGFGHDMVQVSIKRRDRKPVGAERFAHFQRIKNELVGPECEALELYPKESRLVDGAHQYHLWAFTSTDVTIPCGFNGGRLVTPPISEPDGEHEGT